MKWSDVGTQVCSVARALSVVGDRWTLLFVREALNGTTKHEDFVEGVGASRATVADRLARLVEGGIFERRRYQVQPDRYEYLLTEKGRDLLPVILTLAAWGDAWMDDGNGPPMTLRHEGCGQPTEIELACTSCKEPLGTSMTPRYRPDSWLMGRKTTRRRLRPAQQS